DPDAADAGVAVGAAPLDLVAERPRVEEVVEASQGLVLGALEVLRDETVVPHAARILEGLLVAALRYELEALVQIRIEGVHDEVRVHDVVVFDLVERRRTLLVHGGLWRTRDGRAAALLPLVAPQIEPGQGVGGKD